MENQHRKIIGYRELTNEEIALINDIKDMGNILGKIISDLERFEAVDKQWLAIGKTDLQKGIMSIIRAITKPESF